MVTVIVWAVLVVSSIYCIYRHFSSKSCRILGPPSHLFVGHTLQVPTHKTWKYFEKLCHKFGGPIVKVTLAGDDIIVLARRSRNYSSRRPLIYAGQYQSGNLRLTLLPYGDTLKKHRAAFHQMLQPRGMQYTESLRLLVDLLAAPAQFHHHFLRFPASLHINDDGKDLADVQRLFTMCVQDSSPGAHPVDTFPILDRLPDFLSPWRAEAKEKHQRELELYGRPALEVKSRMEKDIGLECFAAHLWEQKAKLNLTGEEIFYFDGTAFAAGTDTSKAQQEIDSIFTPDILPVFTRIQDLPYCFALVKEVLRWAPTAPLGFPHYSDADDEYKGYKVCIQSHLHHNEQKFANSYTFDPERFISNTPGNAVVEDSLADGHYGFGFGRRRSPGQHMAMKSTWMRRPKEFPVDFIPRSVAHIETILAGQASA
ncbi:cytochrome P450 [Mycena capillaripes]|nr:cytochrome P450 [Mycena capillaripes]